MKSIVLILRIITLSVSLLSCNRTPSLVIPNDFQGILPIKEWKVVGPFEFDTLKQNPHNTYYNKDLERYGISEEHFSESDFEILNDYKIKTFSIQTYNSPVNLFDHVDKNQINNKSNFYLYTSVYSEGEEEVVFIFDGSCNYKVWINQRQVLEVLNKKNTHKIGDRFIKVKLQKGNNFVFAKVNRGSNQLAWGILMVGASLKAAQKIYKENYLSDFISDPLISDSISLYLGPYSNARIKIVDSDNNVKLNDSCFNKYQKIFFIKCGGIHDGLYSSKLFLEDDSLEEFIYRGNIFKFIQELKLKSQQLKCDNCTMNDVNAAIERLDFLINKLDESSESEVRYYHSNLIYYSINLHNLIGYVRKNKHDRLYCGTSLKTYFSEKDNAVYHFMLHVSKCLINTPSLPLILFVPYSLVDETMPRSWYIGTLDQIEMDSKMADDYGFAVAWLFMRGTKYTPINAVEEAKNVIKRIKRDYNLDTTKIYLIGECVGGKRALLLAEKCPDLFSGIAVKEPVTMGGDEIEKPIYFVQNLYNIPTCIFHGIYDNEVPIEWSRKFASDAQKVGKFMKVVETETGHLKLSRDERRNSFLFLDSLKTHHQAKRIDTIKYCTCDVGSSSLYWIEICKIKPLEKAEITATYDSSSQNIHVDCKNILEFNVLTNLLDLTKGTDLTIYANNIISYRGTVNRNKVNILLKE